MKRLLGISLTLLIVIALTGAATAVPRLQTYIVGSSYYNNYSYTDRYSWVTNSNYFDLKVVGYWKPAGDMPTGLGCSYGQPTYDYMDCFLSISVPKHQSGTVWINGVEVTGFTRYSKAVPHGVHPNWALPLDSPAIFGRFNFSDIGRIDNSRPNAYHYDHGLIHRRGWGDEIDLNVVVSGYDWAHFDAVGVKCGRTYTNSQSHDASFHAVPEPGTLSLLGVGLLGLVPFLRRKKKK